MDIQKINELIEKYHLTQVNLQELVEMTPAELINKFLTLAGPDITEDITPEPEPQGPAVHTDRRDYVRIPCFFNIVSDDGCTSIPGIWRTGCDQADDAWTTLVHRDPDDILLSYPFGYDLEPNSIYDFTTHAWGEADDDGEQPEIDEAAGFPAGNADYPTTLGESGILDWGEGDSAVQWNWNDARVHNVIKVDKDGSMKFQTNIHITGNGHDCIIPLSANWDDNHARITAAPFYMGGLEPQDAR